MRARRLAVGALLALGLTVPSAGAQSVTQNLGILTDPEVRAIRSISIPVQVRGSLAVDFRGDVARGCAVACDLEGSLLWAPGADAELVVYEYSDHGRREMYGALLGFGARTTAIVTRNLSAPRSCSDVRSDEFFAFDFSAEARDHIDVRIAAAPGADSDGDLLTTRCAGPAEVDIASVLPIRRLDRATLLKGQTTVDLSAEHAFTARGLAGTARSSVVLALGRPRVDSSPEEDGSRRARGRRVRTMSATYRIERMTGDLVARFRGVAEPALCRSLDSCGASGTVRVSPSVSSGEALFIASGPARRSRRQLGAALGLFPGPGAAGIDALGFAFWDDDAGHVAESHANGDGQACNDDGPLGPGSLFFEVTRHRVIATYAGGGFFTGDPFRTRCPGPTFADVTAGGEPVVGSVPVSAFRRPRVVISLTRAGSFETDAYAGRLEPALELVLRRVDVEMEVGRER